MSAAAPALALMGAAWLYWRTASTVMQADGEMPQGDPWSSVLWDTAEELSMPFESIPPDLAARNLAAFLLMIRTAEGTSDEFGYRALFGHRPASPRVFESFADHPRVATQFTDGAGRRLWTTAAGAYQFMAVSALPGGGRTRVNTWDRIKARLSLPDFSPPSQDRAAVALIDEAGALADAQAGRVSVAVDKVRRIWASMPGAGYAQTERKFGELVAAYQAAGGTLA